MDNAKPRCAAGNRSPMTAPEFVKAEAPVRPAKQRSTIREEMFCAPAAPALNAVKRANVIKKMS